MNIQIQCHAASKSRSVREWIINGLPPARAGIDRHNRRDHIHQLREAGDFDAVGVFQQRDEHTADDECVFHRVNVFQQRHHATNSFVPT